MVHSSYNLSAIVLELLSCANHTTTKEGNTHVTKAPFKPKYQNHATNWQVFFSTHICYKATTMFQSFHEHHITWCDIGVIWIVLISQMLLTSIQFDDEGMSLSLVLRHWSYKWFCRQRLTAAERTLAQRHSSIWEGNEAETSVNEYRVTRIFLQQTAYLQLQQNTWQCKYL